MRAEVIGAQAQLPADDLAGDEQTARAAIPPNTARAIDSGLIARSALASVSEVT